MVLISEVRWGKCVPLRDFTMVLVKYFKEQRLLRDYCTQILDY
jgi:hypothetical protein